MFKANFLGAIFYGDDIAAIKGLHKGADDLCRDTKVTLLLGSEAQLG